MTGPTEHFRLMADLWIHLSAIPVDLVQHEYTDSFGSWLFVFERRREKFRIVFDGRDSSLTLEERVCDAKPIQVDGITWVNEWRDIRTILTVPGERDEMIKTITKLIVGEIA